MTTNDDFKRRARALQLYGLLAHWDEVGGQAWVGPLIEWEEAIRQQRSHERRLRAARIGRFKPLCNFDWSWPKTCDREAIESLMSLEFMQDHSNIILIGPNGVGKTMIAQNLAHQAVIRGTTALFTTASHALGELAAAESDAALRRKMKHYTHPELLIIDEVGYLRYGERHADLLFDLISQRYEKKSTIVTTNLPFVEWNQVFPNAACVVTLVDRLIHHADVIKLEGDSYRLKEARERGTKGKKKSALFRIVWKGGHAGVLFKKGLAGRSVNFPVVRKMMLVRLRSDWNPRALTMAA